MERTAPVDRISCRGVVSATAAGDVRRVRSSAELLAAAGQEDTVIEIVGTLNALPMTTLAPGVRMRGGTLRFSAKGVQLTRDNVLEDLTIEAREDEVAISNDSTQRSMGTIRVAGVRTVGRVLLTAEGHVAGGHVEVDGLHVVAAEVRGRNASPRGLGVEAAPGAFTLWNRRSSPAVVLTAVLDGVSAGSVGAPIRGGGVLVAGHGRGGGRVSVPRLRTGEIHVDGGHRLGAPDVISGGVLVLTGAVVDQVVNAGPVSTYGRNDMALANWGEVSAWTAEQAVTTYGPGGMGVANFGTIGRLDVQGPLVMYGTGARAFDFNGGTLVRATFSSIATTGDGSLSVQVANEFPELEITDALTAAGSTG